MNRFLLWMGCLALLTMGSARTSWAQTILAGQIAGTTYTDLVPDKIMDGKAVTRVRITELRDSLDLNNDGVFDLLFKSSFFNPQAQGETASATCYVYTKHNNAGVAFFNGDLSKRLLNDIIKDPLDATASMSQGLWSPDNAFGGFNLSRAWSVYNAPRFMYFGNWNGEDGYLPVRLRTNQNAPWQYGWVRIQLVPDNTNPAYTINLYELKVIIKDYALANTVLALHSAQAAGWQIYPTQVADQLTFEPPTPTGHSQVTVADLCGRAAVQAVVSGRRQQLNLAGLAAGVYLVQLDTPAGHFVQRIVKQ